MIHRRLFKVLTVFVAGTCCQVNVASRLLAAVEPVGSPSPKSGQVVHPLSTPEIERFVNSIRHDFRQYAKAEFAVVSLRMRLRGRSPELAALESESQQLQSAFRRVVEANWPFDQEQAKEIQLEYARADAMAASLNSRAKGGQQPPLDTDAAIAMISEIADRYPNTPLYSRSYLFLGNLCLTAKPRRLEEGYRMFRIAAECGGSLSGWEVIAMTNVASQSSDDTQRLEDRLKFSRVMESLRDLGTLERRLLTPDRIENPHSYVHRVGGALVSIESHYALNGINVLTDAQRSSGMRGVDNLIKKETGNKYLQQEAKRRGWNDMLIELPAKRRSGFYLFTVANLLCVSIVLLVLAFRRGSVRQE